MDGDRLAYLDACWDATAIVQIADNPGRLEPGSGEINFATILGHLHRRGFGGLVELEHHWSQFSREVEQRGIEYLRRLDSNLKAAERARTTRQDRDRPRRRLAWHSPNRWRPAVQTSCLPASTELRLQRRGEINAAFMGHKPLM